MPSPDFKPRSPHWPAVRRNWLATHGVCRMCGRTADLEVHHIRPFHLFPALELDPSNFVTLCEGAVQCHLRTGHLNNWHLYNCQLIADPTLLRQPGGYFYARPANPVDSPPPPAP